MTTLKTAVCSVTLCNYRCTLLYLSHCVTKLSHFVINFKLKVGGHVNPRRSTVSLSTTTIYSNNNNNNNNFLLFLSLRMFYDDYYIYKRHS